MPRNIPSGLLPIINSEVATLATCWKITRKDGQIYAYCNLDAPLTVEGLIYHPLPGLEGTAAEFGESLSVDNQDIKGVITDDDIADDELRNGLFDSGKVEIFTVSYTDPALGRVKEPGSGRIGTITQRDLIWQCEVRSLSAQLQSRINGSYSPTCRARLGDSQCGVNLDAWTVTGTVTSVEHRQRFTASGLAVQDLDWAAGGHLTWTSGASTGLRYGVVASEDGVFTLETVMPRDIGVGDAFTLVAGCDKTPNACKSKFSNIVNFRGERFLPGFPVLITTPWIAH